MTQVLLRKSFNHRENFIKNVLGSQTQGQHHFEEQQQQTLNIQRRNVSSVKDLESWVKNIRSPLES